jgi:hypothetical protein
MNLIEVSVDTLLGEKPLVIETVAGAFEGTGDLSIDRQLFEDCRYFRPGAWPVMQEVTNPGQYLSKDMRGVNGTGKLTKHPDDVDRMRAESAGKFEKLFR